MVRNKRLLFLASLLKGYQVAVDIGCDHGYVLKEAFDQGYITYGIASDLREMPLKSAMKTLENYPVKAILSDGFLAIDEVFDVAMIAGMGAHLIVDIMKHAPLHQAKYILQPNDRYDYLRGQITTMGYRIIDEFVILDKFYYIIMIIEKGGTEISFADLLLGPILKTKKESIPFYQHQAKHLLKIMEHADESRKKVLLEQYHIYQEHLCKVGAKV